MIQYLMCTPGGSLADVWNMYEVFYEILYDILHKIFFEILYERLHEILHDILVHVWTIFAVYVEASVR